jgi:hypothetical protein
MEKDGLFYGRLVQFMIIWYKMAVLSFGILLPFWYIWTKKNLATLQMLPFSSQRVIKPLLHSL